MIEHIRHQDRLLALVIRRDYKSAGIEFFTPGDFSQQVAYMYRDAGTSVKPHYHKEVHRTVSLTQEVLFIKSGRVLTEIFNEHLVKVAELTLEAGDTILLASGGHGFTMLEPTEMIEVKQGPYGGPEDKTIFTPKSDD